MIISAIMIVFLIVLDNAYVKPVYATASTEVIDLANNIDTKAISISFMIPRNAPKEYIE